jgi:hypothetical protein
MSARIRALASTLAALGLLVALTGCMTEADHVRATTLPDGKQGFVIVCNSQRYDRCLSRASTACHGRYTIIPQGRDTVRFGDAVAGVGNSDSILVSCGDASTQGK